MCSVLCESVLVLECCKSWGVAGVKAASILVTAAVEREVSKWYFFS
jgi:hypothetical protein